MYLDVISTFFNGEEEDKWLTKLAMLAFSVVLANPLARLELSPKATLSL